MAAVSVRTGGGADDVSVLLEEDGGRAYLWLGNVTVPRRYVCVCVCVCVCV